MAPKRKFDELRKAIRAKEDPNAEEPRENEEAEAIEEPFVSSSKVIRETLLSYHTEDELRAIFPRDELDKLWQACHGWSPILAAIENLIATDDDEIASENDLREMTQAKEKAEEKEWCGDFSDDPPEPATVDDDDDVSISDQIKFSSFDLAAPEVAPTAPDYVGSVLSRSDRLRFDLLFPAKDGFASYGHERGTGDWFVVHPPKTGMNPQRCSPEKERDLDDKMYDLFDANLPDHPLGEFGRYKGQWFKRKDVSAVPNQDLRWIAIHEEENRFLDKNWEEIVMTTREKAIERRQELDDASTRSTLTNTQLINAFQEAIGTRLIWVDVDGLRAVADFAIHNWLTSANEMDDDTDDLVTFRDLQTTQSKADRDPDGNHWHEELAERLRETSRQLEVAIDQLMRRSQSRATHDQGPAMSRDIRKSYPFMRDSWDDDQEAEGRRTSRPR